MDKELQNLLDNYEQAIYGYTKPIMPSIHQIHLLLDYIANLEQQYKKKKEVIDKIKKHCEIEINASNHYLRNHSSQQELCHKVAHQRILDILKEVSE